ncbi:MAG: hypothetical protein JST01_03335 [Cyanobacteria bacterium SZAS TMP-1]|nr:hypothetical protein [Cyanobacteria bacterium SZAS TMP-1]
MSTTDTTTAEARTPTPYEQLVSAARKAMIKAYPDKKKALESGKLWRIEEGFAMDAMGEKGKCMFIHRLDEARQAEEIGDNPDAIFEGLSDSMLAFYRKKLDEAKA